MFYRSLESNLFNKANELQEELSMKRFDMRSYQLQLASLKAQVNKIAMLLLNTQIPC